MNIYLDDKRVPSMSHDYKKGLGQAYSTIDEWFIIRDYFEFVDVVDKNFNKIELISFDHDLGCFRDGKEWTGKDAADYIITYCLDNKKSFPDWYVHTDNTAGRMNILSAILSYLNKVEGKDIKNFRYYHNGMFKNKFI